MDVDVLSIVLVVNSVVVLTIPFIVEKIPCVVERSDSITVVTVDVSEEVTTFCTIAADAVDNALVCRSVESVYWDDATGVDVTAAEVGSSVEDTDKYPLVDEILLDDGKDVDTMVVRTVSDVIDSLLD